jgi:hypothetical protein
MPEQQVQAAMVKIDGIDYKVEDLSDEAKVQLQSIQVAKAEIKRLKMQLALVQTAQNAYMQALTAALPDQA